MTVEEAGAFDYPKPPMWYIILLVLICLFILGSPYLREMI